MTGSVAASVGLRRACSADSDGDSVIGSLLRLGAKIVVAQKLSLTIFNLNLSLLQIVNTCLFITIAFLPVVIKLVTSSKCGCKVHLEKLPPGQVIPEYPSIGFVYWDNPG